MIKIEIEEIEKILNRITEINKFDLEKVELFKNGIKIDIPDEVIKLHKKSLITNIRFFSEYI